MHQTGGDAEAVEHFDGDNGSRVDDAAVGANATSHPLFLRGGLGEFGGRVSTLFAHHPIPPLPPTPSLFPSPIKVRRSDHGCALSLRVCLHSDRAVLTIDSNRL